MFDESQEQSQRSLEDYWGIARRRRWWIFLPVFLCWAAVWVAGSLWPSTYESEAVILVEQQKVPEQYVVPNVSVDLQDRLQSMTQQILSRTRLQATVDQYHLYPRHKGLTGALQSDDAVEQMRKDIKIELVEAPGRRGELTAFKIRYSAGTAELAQQVNSQLTSLFIDENLKSQQALSESTTTFLENQLAGAKAKLEEQEAKVRAFKAQHLGELPSQLESNVQILSGLQAQLQATQRALDGAQQQKLYFESLLQQYQSAQTSVSSGGEVDARPDLLDRELQDLRRRLTEARSLYTDNYPDVVALKDEIAKTEKLKKQAEEEAASSQPTDNPETAKAVAKDTPKDAPKDATKDTTKDSAQGDAKVAAKESPKGTGTSTGHLGATTAMMQIQSQLKANLLEIQNYQRRVKDLEATISGYQARLNLIPGTEQQLLEISRGYEESKTNYNSLLQKQMQSQLATSLERRQQGEQFRTIDPPSLPIKPSAPNHLMISVGGLLLGIVVGIGLAALLELTDARVQQEKDLKELIPVRVLVGIPHLSTPGEQGRAARLRWMERGTVAAMFILILAGNIYVLLKG
jgi:succinoglycan biosynthesis transport protein ExoP